MSKDQIFENSDEMLPIRMGEPEFTLEPIEAMPGNVSESTLVFIDYLLDLGFIYSHEICVKHAVGKPEGDSARIIAYVNVDQSIYALVSDLYHTQHWVQFTSYYPNGERIITTSQPGALLLEPVQRVDNIDAMTVQNAGSATVDTQWKKHRRLTASQMPDETAVVFKPDQHMAVEEGFYSSYVQHLLNSNILQQSDTQTVRFTRSGAYTYHLAITSRSARRPQPKVEQWIGKRGKIPLRQKVSRRNCALTAGALAVVGLVTVLIKNPQFMTNPEVAEPATAAAVVDPEGKEVALNTETSTDVSEHSSEVTTTELPDSSTTVAMANSATNNHSDDSLPQAAAKARKEQLVLASSEDEMWRIAVENAEFFLMSNDGDPTPWIRTARKIAAGFKTNDSRLGRTYFLSALLESDYRIAEQQFNRALSIQTKSLGLYHAETAQTLEALAWIAEHNKEALDEAITHQRLAINIYRDIFGADAEDTRAAQWKLEYFEDRLAGIRPKSEGNNRLLPALARFGR